MMQRVIPRRHFVVHAIPAATIIAIVAIAFSGIDSGGDLPGLLRLLVVLLSAALWSLLFSVSMLVHVVRSKRWRRRRSSRRVLEHGSLLLMRGDSQALSQHSLPKTRRPVGLRINLTFRRVIPQEARIAAPGAGSSTKR